MTNFYVNQGTSEIIQMLGLDLIAKETLLRCVGGYSAPRSFLDGINKVRYRWNQYFISYSDWEQSIQLLENRKIELKGFGRNQLIKLIQDNNLIPMPEVY